MWEFEDDNFVYDLDLDVIIIFEMIFIKDSSFNFRSSGFG